jgi:hypothetical protein
MGLTAAAVSHVTAKENSYLAHNLKEYAQFTLCSPGDDDAEHVRRSLGASLAKGASVADACGACTRTTSYFAAQLGQSNDVDRESDIG